MTEAHVFISYSHKDAEFAYNLQHKLEKAEFGVWLDQERLRAGEDWREEIDTAIYDAFTLVLILSPDSMLSQYVMYEWSFAWGAGKKIIPVLYKDIEKQQEMHPRLDKRQYLNLTNPNDREWEKLIRRLQEIDSEYNPTTFRLPRNAPPAVKRAVAALDSHIADERDEALKSLAQMDHPTATDMLIAALEHTTRNVRVKVLELMSLKSVRDLRIVPGILKNLEDESSSIRRLAANMLGETTESSAVVGLIRTLDDEKDRSSCNSSKCT